MILAGRGVHLKQTFAFTLGFLFITSGVLAAETVPAENRLSSKEGELKIAGKKAPVKAPAQTAIKATGTTKREIELADADPADLALKGNQKTLSGMVSAVGPSGIAVEFKYDAETASAEEVWLTFSKAVKFDGYKKYTQIQYGDRVQVVYMEAKDKSKRVLQEVKFLSHKPRETAPAAKTPEETVPADEAQNEAQ